MTYFNEKNEHTEKVIHLMVTDVCKRNCKHCCNKQYSVDSIPVITEDELRHAETVLLTGGEPLWFLRHTVSDYAYMLKAKYPNIKRVYVYANAVELQRYLDNKGSIFYINGFSVSIKGYHDYLAFEDILMNHRNITDLSSNRLYILDGSNYHFSNPFFGFEVIKRQWQEDFKPASDSIFRRVEKFNVLY